MYRRFKRYRSKTYRGFFINDIQRNKIFDIGFDMANTFEEYDYRF